MNPTMLLVIAAGAGYLLANNKTKVASTANLTAQQRQAAAAAAQQNSLFAGLGTLIKSLIGGSKDQPKSSGGSSMGSSGGSSSGSHSGACTHASPCPARAGGADGSEVCIGPPLSSLGNPTHCCTGVPGSPCCFCTPGNPDDPGLGDTCSCSGGELCSGGGSQPCQNSCTGWCTAYCNPSCNGGGGCFAFCCFCG